MASKVSGRLAEAVASEICEHIYTPRLARDFNTMFPYITFLNRVHLLALVRDGHVMPETAVALADALDEVEQMGPDAVALDPQREDAYFNYEAHLMKVAGPELGGILHVARSRNDLNAAIDRIRAREALLDVAELLCDLLGRLLTKAEAYKDVLMPGYTHLQPAQPISFGFYLAGIASALARDADRLLDSWPRINTSPLGAGALAGTTFHLDRAHLAELAGFESVIPNTLDAVASRDFGLELLSVFASLSCTWSRMAQDLFVWVTNEFQSVEFPDSVCGASSIMPQKKNPVVLEHLKGRAGYFLGLHTAAAATMKAVNFTNTIDGNRGGMQPVWDGFEEMRHCLLLTGLVVDSVTPNRDVLEARASRDFSTVTDLADMLYRRHRIPFRAGHRVVGLVVRDALAAGQGAAGITAGMIEKAIDACTGHHVVLDDDEVRQCLDPSHSLLSRTEDGAPAPQAVAASVQRLRRRLVSYRSAVTYVWEKGLQAQENVDASLSRLRVEAQQ